MNNSKSFSWFGGILSLLIIITNVTSINPSNRKERLLFDYLTSRNVQNGLSGRPNLSPAINSPIYYIRMPPVPYSFVPGLGYVSQPSLQADPSLFNLPLPFAGNGKPVTIYRWNGAFQHFPQLDTPPKPVTNPPPTSDSYVDRVPGHHAFNGKPDHIYLLRDSYDNMLEDTLQNIYP